MKPNYEKILEDLTLWISMMMKKIGGKKAVLGVSGGKDSSITAALMAKVLGKENVIGVLMPDGEQNDISFARDICSHLGIRSMEADICDVTSQFKILLKNVMDVEITRQTTLNLPPRVRMTLLYAISQSVPESRVINTSNMSEDWVGYATVYGDTAGAFSPLGMLTTEDVIELGRLMNIPEKFLVKPPSDGLTGKTDEEVLGISYEAINKYIREGIAEPKDKELIDTLNKFSRFKFETIPMFNPNLPVVPEDTSKIYKK